MAQLQPMPSLVLPSSELLRWGQWWLQAGHDENNRESKSRAFSKREAMDFAALLDDSVGQALSDMIGDIPIGQNTMWSS